MKKKVQSIILQIHPWSPKQNCDDWYWPVMKIYVRQFVMILIKMWESTLTTDIQHLSWSIFSLFANIWSVYFARTVAFIFVWQISILEQCRRIEDIKVRNPGRLYLNEQNVQTVVTCAWVMYISYLKACNCKIKHKHLYLRLHCDHSALCIFESCKSTFYNILSHTVTN